MLEEFVLLCWRGWKPRREKSVGVRGLRRDMWWVVLWRKLLEGWEAGLRNGMSRSMKGRENGRINCCAGRTKVNVYVTVEGCPKVVEVNRGSASSVCGLGLRCRSSYSSVPTK